MNRREFIVAGSGIVTAAGLPLGPLEYVKRGGRKRKVLGYELKALTDRHPIYLIEGGMFSKTQKQIPLNGTLYVSVDKDYHIATLDPEGLIDVCEVVTGPKGGQYQGFFFEVRV